MPEGIEVVPDELVLPIRLRAEGKTPLKAASDLAARFHSAQDAAGGLLEPSRYRSWTEKLAGKSFGGHGVRHHAEAIALALRPLDNADFFARVQLLETLRAALAPLDDGAYFAVGVAEWRVSDVEAHRAAVVEQRRSRVESLSKAFGVPIERVDGSHALSVVCLNPMSAIIQLNVGITLSSAA